MPPTQPPPGGWSHHVGPYGTPAWGMGPWQYPTHHAYHFNWVATIPYKIGEPNPRPYPGMDGLATPFDIPQTANQAIDSQTAGSAAQIVKAGEEIYSTGKAAGANTHSASNEPIQIQTLPLTKTDDEKDTTQKANKHNLTAKDNPTPSADATVVTPEKPSIWSVTPKNIHRSQILKPGQ